MFEKLKILFYRTVIKFNNFINIKNTHTKFPKITINNQKKLEKFFNEIPSETSINERLFLYAFSKEIASDGNIIELGPFLGGTTRAIAKGIEDSQSRKKNLITIDMFSNYYSLNDFTQFKLDIGKKFVKNNDVEFIEIFNAFHKNHSYNKYIKTISAKIPDSPSEKFDYGLFKDLKISAVFIDGCKSWYSTRSFCSELLDLSKPGTYFLFQDYGRFTCFWIPYFTALMEDFFELVHVVDSTYVFKLIKNISKQDVLEIFKESPKSMDSNVMKNAFEKMLEIANGLNKKEKVTVYIHKAAYHAYINEKEKSKEILVNLLKDKLLPNYLKNRVNSALISPTYTPDSKIYL